MAAGAPATPPGFGHTFAPEDYIDAWFELTEREGWSGEDVQRLEAHFGGTDRTER